MSIRIVPENEVNTTADRIPPLLFPNLKNLYSRRAERFRTLAENHPLGEYLHFAAALTEAQQHILRSHPLEGEGTTLMAQAKEEAPLDVRSWVRDAYWREVLQHILHAMRPVANAQIVAVLDNLQKASQQELEDLADALLHEEFSQVGSDKAPFIWAALSLYWSQMAEKLPAAAYAEEGEHRQFCPVCHSMPVASMLHLGTEKGLRYLHCSLCESDWHVVRVKCSNCEQSQELNYWSLESEHAPIKAESCGECGSYLKIFYQEKDPQMEIVADDLASLVLDAKMEEEGFARSSINPFLYPGE